MFVTQVSENSQNEILLGDIYSSAEEKAGGRGKSRGC